MNCFSCVPLEVLYVAIISIISLLKVVAVFFFLLYHTYRAVTFKAPSIVAVEGHTNGIVHC